MKITKFFALLCAAAAFVGCEPVDGYDDDDDGGYIPSDGSMILEVDNQAVKLNDSVNFKVWYEGANVTDQAIIYSVKDNYSEIEPKYTPSTTGSYKFYATMGDVSSNYITVTVLKDLPTLPEDPDKDNIFFNHRVIIIDHTGVNCGNCPRVMDGLKLLAETEEWNNSYNEVTCHGGGYASPSVDNAYSKAAAKLDEFQRPGGYPNVRLNLYDTTEISIGYANDFLNSVVNNIFKTSKLQKSGADVGISVAVTGDENALYAIAEIKSAKTQQYKAMAWLLESDIHNPGQGGAKGDKNDPNNHYYFHDHALREISYAYSKTNMSGEEIGLIEEGKSITTAFELKIDKNANYAWNHENMGVLVIVTALNGRGQWEVVNSRYCPINESRAFEYLSFEE